MTCLVTEETNPEQGNATLYRSMTTELAGTYIEVANVAFVLASDEVRSYSTDGIKRETESRERHCNCYGGGGGGG
jgi:hypothetical protein